MKQFSLIFILMFSGCGIKEYQLFNNTDPSYISQEDDINISYESKIMPDDILIIETYNMSQKSNILENSGQKESNENANKFIVSEEGVVYLPLLEEVKVKGQTVKELSKKLTNSYKKYLQQPYTKVTIKNHKVFVLGEVKEQGIVPIEGNSISIIEAISSSGGLTDHASRNKIRVISKEGGKHKIRTLDMSRLSTLNIDNLVLKHNSIVYVEPRGSKALKVGMQDYLPIIQAISGIASTFLSIDYISNGRD
jgi:polysaccharide export outer membrane protein